MQNKWRKFIILILFFTVIISLSACSNSFEDSFNTNGYLLEGKIIDNDGEGVQGVKIKAESSDQITETDSNGNYKLNVPKDATKVSIIKDGYDFTKNNFEITKDKTANITAYPTKNSSMAGQYITMRNTISQIISENYNSENHASSITNIKKSIKDKMIMSEKIPVIKNYNNNFKSDSNSISIKFPRGGIETWLLSSSDFKINETNYENNNLVQNISNQNTNFNENLSPGNNKALIINSHYNENERNDIAEDIAVELNNMGYNVDIISGNKATENIYTNLNQYGIVYIQSYIEQYNNDILLMSGQSVEHFNNLSDELYQLYMTKKASPIGIKENNNYSNYYWGINSNYLLEHFTSANNTVIFSASGGLNKNQELIDKFLNNGASAFISTNNAEIKSEPLLALIKEMRQHTKLRDAYNNLSISSQNNISYKKNEDIYISTDIDNQPPNLVKIDDKTIDENNTLDFTINATDPDNKETELEYEANGELSKYFNPDTKKFNWTPGYNDGGVYEILLTVEDKYYSDSQKIKIKVNDVPKDGTVKWMFNNNGENKAIFNTPAVNHNSVSHIYSNSYLLSQNIDGSNNLDINIGGLENRNFQSSIVINQNDDIYYAKDKLYAYNSEGILKWTFKDNYDFYSQPALDKEGNIYFSGYEKGKNSRLYKIIDKNTRGQNVWNNTGNMLNGSKATAPSISQDNKLYVADNEGYIYAFLTQGNYGEAIKLWEKKISQDGFISNPIIAEDGSIYLADQSGELYLLKPTGEIYGSIDLDNDPITSSPIIDNEGNVFVANDSGNLYKINPEPIKENLNRNSLIPPFDPLKISNEKLSTPALASNGTLYINSKDSKVYAINSNTGESEWQEPLKTNNAIYSNPTLDNNGIVHITSSDSYLYTIHSNSNSPANTPWPMYRANKYNSGLRDYNSSGNPPYILLIPIHYTPEIKNGEIEIAEYSTMELVFAGGDPDGDQLDLILENTTIPETEYNYNSTTRIFSWTPGDSSADNSPYQLNFKAVDSEGKTAYKTLDVVVNDENIATQINEIKLNSKALADYDSLPVFKENKEIKIAINADDPDGDNANIIYSLSGEGSSNFTQNANIFTWTPSPDLLDNGESKNYTITAKADDQEGNYFENDGGNIVEIDFTVNNNDRPPELDSISKESYTVKEESKLSINVGASDPDGDSINYKIEPLDSNSFSQLSNYIDLTDAVGESGEIVIEPSYELVSYSRDDNPSAKSKTYSFYVIAESNGLESNNKKEIEVTIENNNRPPIIENRTELREITLQKDENYVGFTIQGYDEDEEDQENLTYELVDNAGVDTGKYNFDNGEFYWSNPGVGEYNMEARVSDGKDYSQIVDIQINVENYPPEFVDLNSYQGGSENNLLEFDIVVNDPNGNSITDVFASSGSEFPENELISDYIEFDKTDEDNNSIWTFAWKPNYDQAGDYDVSFVAETDDGDTVTKSILLSIDNKNGSPTLDFLQGRVFNDDGTKDTEFTSDNQTITEGQKIEFEFNFNDPDQDDMLTIMAQVRDNNGDKIADEDGIYIEDKLLDNEQTEFTKDEYNQSGFSTILDWKTAVDNNSTSNTTYTIRFIINDGQKTVEKVFSITVNSQ